MLKKRKKRNWHTREIEVFEKKRKKSIYHENGKLKKWNDNMMDK